MTPQRSVNGSDKSHQAETILQRAVCLTLERHYLGNKRTVSLESVVDESGGTMTLDEAQFHTTMKLIDRKELHAPMRVIRSARNYLRGMAIPTPRVFGERTYLVPLGAVKTVDDRLTEIRTELHAEGFLLSQRYAAAVERQKLAVGKLFDPKLYPSPERIAKAFDIDWAYVSFSAPERLETVDRALFESTQRKYERRMGEAYDEVKLVLRETLRQLVGDIASKLTPGPDGKPRVFRNTVLEGLTEFLGTFDMRNIADDADLKRVVGRLRKMTRGVDPERLREMDDVRADVAAGMLAATAELDKLVATGRRAISFEPLSAEMAGGVSASA